MAKYYIIETGETVEGTLHGTDEMFDGDLFYQILTVDGTQYKAYYLNEHQEDAKDEYGNLILDCIDYSRISYVDRIDD